MKQTCPSWESKSPNAAAFTHSSLSQLMCWCVCSLPASRLWMNFNLHCAWRSLTLFSLSLSVSLCLPCCHVFLRLQCRVVEVRSALCRVSVSDAEICLDSLSWIKPKHSSDVDGLRVKSFTFTNDVRLLHGADALIYSSVLWQFNQTQFLLYSTKHCHYSIRRGLKWVNWINSLKRKIGFSLRKSNQSISTFKNNKIHI